MPATEQEVSGLDSTKATIRCQPLESRHLSDYLAVRNEASPCLIFGARSGV